MPAERRLGGRQILITADPVLANYVFNGPNKRNYVQRPASNEGLARLGMLNRGLIWNSDTAVWRKIRGCFQHSLGEVSLHHAVNVVKKECSVIVQNLLATQSSSHTEGGTLVDLLQVCRKVTFRATLSVFFGLDSSDFDAKGIDEDTFIDTIVSYFKAWEYFLFRSYQHCHQTSALEKVHLASVERLVDLVRHLLGVTLGVSQNEPSPSLDDVASTRLPSSSSSSSPTKRTLFADLLDQACCGDETLLVQSALEMMLAGTDTSSVTAYYALLGLAGDAALQRDLRQGGGKGNAGTDLLLLDSLIQETLRFKPVGPIVLRQAVSADENIISMDGGGGDKLTTKMEAGAAVWIHLAAMNQRSDLWENAHEFCPRRFVKAVQKKKKKFFFPFGDGPKGCIGMHLGRREVAAIVETVNQAYNLSIVEQADGLKSLETHWDIANQPDHPTRIRLDRVA